MSFGNIMLTFTAMQDAGLLTVPRISKQTAGGRAFSYRAQVLWNVLPTHVRDTDSVCGSPIGRQSMPKKWSSIGDSPASSCLLRNSRDN